MTLLHQLPDALALAPSLEALNKPANNSDCEPEEEAVQHPIGFVARVRHRVALRYSWCQRVTNP